MLFHMVKYDCACPPLLRMGLDSCGCLWLTQMNTISPVHVTSGGQGVLSCGTSNSDRLVRMPVEKGAALLQVHYALSLKSSCV